jgi:hypothetical protein
MTEYLPVGVRHFLRRLDPEGASELRRHVVPLRNGSSLPKLAYANLDRFQLGEILYYRTLVLRRSPFESRPPAPDRLVREGRWYEVWQRPSTYPPIVADLPLGQGATPTAAEPTHTDCARPPPNYRRRRRRRKATASVLLHPQVGGSRRYAPAMGGAAPSTPDASPLTPDSPAGGSRRRARVRVGAVLALALAAAFVAWLVWGRPARDASRVASRDDDPSQSGADTVAGRRDAPDAGHPCPTSRSVAPEPGALLLGRLATAHAHRAHAHAERRDLHPLPAADCAGRRRARFPDRRHVPEVERIRRGEERRQRTERQEDRVGRRRDRHLRPKAATNVHIAYPAQPYQVEVYAPGPSAATGLVTAGAVRPID